MLRYDHIVIGAGIVGSSAALQLAKKGRKVLLLEQFPIPHTRGSSHGASRMIRSCYSDACFASMMPDAVRMWKELEEETGSTLIIRTGVFFICETASACYRDSVKNMQLYSPEDITLISMSEVTEKYPMVSYPPDYSVFLDKTGGIIRANKALSVVQELYKKNGGHLWDNCKVSGIEPGDEVKVSTTKGDVITPSLVVCSGCWTRNLLTPHLIQSVPLQPSAVKVCYWKEKKVGKCTVGGGFPAFIDCTSETKPIYGLPSLEYPSLVKVCIHGGVPCDPDERDKAVPDETLKIRLQEYVRKHLQGLEPTASIVETCMYTSTPDEIFVLDRLPDHKNIIIGTGFSGTGFKTSPVVGKLLSEMAIGQAMSHDLSPFLLSRFNADVV